MKLYQEWDIIHPHPFLPLPWADGFLWHVDTSLGGDLNARLLKVLAVAGVHDNKRHGLILHHVEQLVRGDPSCRHGSYVRGRCTVKRVRKGEKELLHWN